MIEVLHVGSTWNICLVDFRNRKTTPGPPNSVLSLVGLDLPFSQLIYPTLGKAESSSKLSWEGIC